MDKLHICPKCIYDYDKGIADSIGYRFNNASIWAYINDKNYEKLQSIELRKDVLCPRHKQQMQYDLEMKRGRS